MTFHVNKFRIYHRNKTPTVAYILVSQLASRVYQKQYVTWLVNSESSHIRGYRLHFTVRAQEVLYKLLYGHERRRCTIYQHTDNGDTVVHSAMHSSTVFGPDPSVYQSMSPSASLSVSEHVPMVR